jgi:hypothetical protein
MEPQTPLVILHRRADNVEMRACIETTPRRLVIATLLATVTSLSVLGCSAAVSGPANLPLPPGEWTATGTVLSGGSFINEPTGTVLKRPWATFN